MNSAESGFLDNEKLNILKSDLGINLSSEQVLAFEKWHKIFIEYNLHTNLMSKNETANLFEKHVYDSLSAALSDSFKNRKKGLKVLDIGTGGGFPGVILALAYPQITVIANDSRMRKIKFIEEAKEILELKNLSTVCERAENLEPQSADIITFRAVGKIKDFLPLAKRHAKCGTEIIFYKAKGVKEEIQEALRADRNLKSPEIIPYSLPLNVETTRNLVIFRV